MVVERGSTGKYLKEEAGKEKVEEVVKEYLKSSCILKREVAKPYRTCINWLGRECVLERMCSKLGQLRTETQMY